jgi:hypothetical protein
LMSFAAWASGWRVLMKMRESVKENSFPTSFKNEKDATNTRVKNQ